MEKIKSTKAEKNASPFVYEKRKRNLIKKTGELAKMCGKRMLLMVRDPKTNEITAYTTCQQFANKDRIRESLMNSHSRTEENYNDRMALSHQAEPMLESAGRD